MASTATETATEYSTHRCGVALGDHCPKCGSCECAITRGVLHPTNECPGELRRMGTLTPFGRR